MQIKYSFIIPFYKRLALYEKTLNSFKNYYSERKDVEIITVCDVKQLDDWKEHDKLMDLLDEYSLTFRMVYSTAGTKECVNPCLAYNVGASMALGEFLVITNPECLHATNILQHTDVVFNADENKYIICGCMDVPSGTWYQHSIHRPANLHFCSLISKENYKKVGGFDENFAQGIAWEDNDFRDCVQKLGIPFEVRDDLVVLHQHHESICTKENFNYYWELNRQYYVNKHSRG